MILSNGNRLGFRRRAPRPALRAGISFSQRGCAGWTGLLSLLSGCALFPQIGMPPIEGPPAPLLLTAEQAPIVRAFDPVPVPAVTDFRGYAQVAYPGEYDFPSATDRRFRRPVLAPGPREPAGDEVEAEVVTDSVASSPEEPITIVTHGGTETRDAVKRELEEAVRLVRESESEGLAKPEREKVRDLYDLIEQAEHALQRGDVSSAAGLARKARLLAAELTAP
jgi:hypothetical protein